MITFIGKPEIRNFIYKELGAYETAPSSNYIINEYRHRLFHIKIYSTGTITIQGSKEKDIYIKFLDILNENKFIGMDEVGVGDFFGPTVYTAVRLDKESVDGLKKFVLNIKDSKKLSDEEIVEIYKKVKGIVNYEVEVKYDANIDLSMNSVEQKMYYHFKNYQKLYKGDEKQVIIDLFTTENNFFKVAKKLGINYEENLILETKADSKYVVVALASIISRYYFIREMKLLNKKYNYNFPYGANVKVQAQEFANMYSKKEMSKFCKTSFKTFNEVK